MFGNIFSRLTHFCFPKKKCVFFSRLRGIYPSHVMHSLRYALYELIHHINRVMIFFFNRMHSSFYFTVCTKSFRKRQNRSTHNYRRNGVTWETILIWRFSFFSLLVWLNFLLIRRDYGCLGRLGFHSFYFFSGAVCHLTSLTLLYCIYFAPRIDKPGPDGTFCDLWVIFFFPILVFVINF